MTWSYKEELKSLLIVSGTRLAPGEAIWETKLKLHLSDRYDFLTGFLNLSALAEPQLKQVGPAIKSAAEKGDVPFAMALREKKLEIWGRSITGEGAVERIIAIRRLIPSAQDEQDEPFRLKSFRFLGTQIARSMMMDKGEPGIINQVLVDLRPNLSGLKEGGLRFEVVLSTIASCESGQECKKFLARLDKALDGLRNVANERQPILETALKELFQNLTVEEKRKVWEQMLDEIESSYLFTVEPAAWPAGLEPLPARARRALSTSTRKPANRLAGVLDRLVRLPIYETEMRSILRAAETGWARQRLVENCHAAISQLRSGSRSLPVYNFQLISERLLKTQEGSGFDCMAALRWSGEVAGLPGKRSS